MPEQTELGQSGRSKELDRRLLDKALPQGAIIAALVLALTLPRLLWLNTILTNDEAVGGYAAMLWDRGLPPYEGTIDNKGLFYYGIYLVNIKLFGNTVIPDRLLADSLFALSLLALYGLARPLYGRRAALLAMLLYGFASSAPILDGHLATADPLSMPFTVLSLFFCVRYMTSKGDGHSDSFLAGLFLGIAALIHPLRLVGIIPLGYALSRRSLVELSGSHARLRQGLGRPLRHALLAALGLAIPACVALFMLWHQGAADDVAEAVSFSTSTYGDVPDVPFGHYFMIAVEALPVWLAGAFAIPLLFRSPDHRLGFVLAALLPPLLVIVGLPPRYGHKFLALLPMVAVVGAVALASLLTWGCTMRSQPDVSVRVRAASLCAVAMILWLGTISSLWLQAKHFPDYNIHWGFVNWDWASFGSYDQQEAIAQYIKTHSQASEPIFVHDNFPHIYWLSGRRAPTKNLTTYRLPGIYIPDSEYQRLVEQISNQEFAYIGLHHWPPDEIMDSVRRNYLPVAAFEDDGYRFFIYARPTIQEEASSRTLPSR